MTRGGIFALHPDGSNKSPHAKKIARRRTWIELAGIQYRAKSAQGPSSVFKGFREVAVGAWRFQTRPADYQMALNTDRSKRFGMRSCEGVCATS
jgi:hypothetical protein